VVGIVIVSHSYRIAEGVAELAREMGGPGVHIETAGGLDLPDHPIGTDAVMVQQAIERAWSDDGVLVLMDLGSAVLSAEMALELLSFDDAKRDQIVIATKRTFTDAIVRAMGRGEEEAVAAPAAPGHAIGVLRLEQVSIGTGDRRLPLPQRRDVVEDPEAAAMRGGDQVAILDREVVNRHDRQVESQ